MIIPTIEYDDDWRDTAEGPPFYWLVNPKIVRQLTRLEQKVDNAPSWALVTYKVCLIIRYVILTLIVFISVLLMTHNDWAFSVGITYFYIGGNFFWDVTALGDPVDRSHRRDRLLKKATRIIRTTTADQIPISDGLASFCRKPAERAAMLEQAPEISRLLIEGEIAEAHRLLGLPDRELDPRLRTELQRKVDGIERQIIEHIKQTVTAHQCDDQARQLEAQNEAKARLAGNNRLAELLLRKFDE